MANGRKRRVEQFQHYFAVISLIRMGDAILCEYYVRKDEPGRAMQGQEGSLDLGLYQDPPARVYAVGWGCDVQRGPSLCLIVNVTVNGEWV